MNCNKFYQTMILLAALLIVSSAVADTNGTTSDASKALPPDTSLYIELGGANDPDAIGGTIGMTVDASEYLTYNAGLTYFASEHSSDVFGGVSLGLRTRVTKHRIMPFIGFGVFSGITKAYVPADDDDIDNDGDGTTDEPGEEDEIVDDVLCSIYPEVGLNLMLTPESGITLSAKRHFTTEGSDYRFWMYSMAFSVFF